MPEELRLHEGLGQGGARHVHEGPVGPGAQVVDEPGRQSLAGPGLPQEEDGGGVRRGDAPHQVQDLVHGRARADDVSLDATRPAQRTHFAAQARTLQSGLQRRLQAIQGEGLLQVVLRSLLQGLHRRLDGGVGGDHDAGDVLLGGQLLQEFGPVPIGETDVQERRVGV